jgi:hypothetical protein
MFEVAAAYEVSMGRQTRGDHNPHERPRAGDPAGLR